MVGWNPALHWKVPGAVNPAGRPTSKLSYPHFKCSSNCGLRGNRAPHFKNVIPRRSNPSQHGRSVETLEAGEGEQRWTRKKGRREMERSEGAGTTTVGLVFVPLLGLRLQTDILRLNLVFSLCRVVQNVLIFYKNVIWPLPCYWEPAQRGQFSSVGGECTKMGV